HHRWHSVDVPQVPAALTNGTGCVARQPGNRRVFTGRGNHGFGQSAKANRGTGPEHSRGPPGTERESAPTGLRDSGSGEGGSRACGGRAESGRPDGAPRGVGGPVRGRENPCG